MFPSIFATFEKLPGYSKHIEQSIDFEQCISSLHVSVTWYQTLAQWKLGKKSMTFDNTTIAKSPT